MNPVFIGFDFQPKLGTRAKIPRGNRFLIRFVAFFQLTETGPTQLHSVWKSVGLKSHSSPATMILNRMVNLSSSITSFFFRPLVDCKSSHLPSMTSRNN